MLQDQHLINLVKGRLGYRWIQIVMKRLKRLKRVRANKLSKIEQTDESFLFSFALGPKTAGLRAAMAQGS